MMWIALIFAVLISIGITYLVLRPRIIATQELDAKTAEQNAEIRSENIRLLAESSSLENINLTLSKQNERLRQDNESATNHLNDLNDSIVRVEKQAQQAADLFYQSKMEVAQNKLSQDLADLAKQHEENVQHFSNEYSHIVSDTLDRFKDLSDQIAIMQATTDAAIAAAKRAEEMKDNLAFYRIQLSAADVKEIELLRSVEPYLRDKEPLNKVIWKCYYEKPTTDMIGRVVGSGVKTGIPADGS